MEYESLEKQRSALEKQVKDEEGKRQVIEREQKVVEREKENSTESDSIIREWDAVREARKHWLAYCEGKDRAYDEERTQRLAAEGKERDAKEEAEKYKQANLMLQTKVLALEAKLAEKKPAKKRKRQN